MGCGEDILGFLIKAGVDINARNNNGVAPIHIVAKYGKIGQMEFFIRKKANLDVVCGKFTASETDILKENYVNVRGNIDASSTIVVKNNSDHEGATPIMISASDNRNVDVVYALASEGASSNPVSIQPGGKIKSRQGMLKR